MISMTAKEEARRLLDRLPDDITWDRLMYELWVRRKITQGEQAVDQGRVTAHEDVKKRFLAR